MPKMHSLSLRGHSAVPQLPEAKNSSKDALLRAQS